MSRRQETEVSNLIQKLYVIAGLRAAIDPLEGGDKVARLPPFRLFRGSSHMALLEKDPSLAFPIDPRKWEEILAAS
jgi:hypothetical protein